MSQSTLSSNRPSLAQTFVGPRGHSLLPGGFGKVLTAVGPWSPMASRGEGWRLWDSDGRELIDLHGNFTVNIHGNAHPAITHAATGAIAHGLSFGLPNHHEIEHARRLVERITRLDQVRYTNSGTEAIQLAVRLARARTERSAIVVVSGSYHGWSESVLPTLGARAERGVPSGMLEETVVIDFDDVSALEAAIASGPKRFAAILLDLLPNRVGMVPPSDAFVETAVRLSRQHGIALVVDEVISFRLAKGGLTTARNVDADFVCLGKSIGGGLPVGALVGKAEWMAGLDPRARNNVEHGGTFAGNPVTMAAGVVTLDLLDDNAIAHIDQLGRRFRERLTEPLARKGWEPRGQGSLCRLFPTIARNSAEVIEKQGLLWWALYERGVHIAKHGVVAISTVMDDAVIDHAVAIVADTMEDSRLCP